MRRSAALRRALDEFVVEGIRTNIPFLRRIVDHPDFIARQLRHRTFLERLFDGRTHTCPCASKPDSDSLTALAT